MSNENSGSVDIMSTGDKPKTEIRINEKIYFK